MNEAKIQRLRLEEILAYMYCPVQYGLAYISESVPKNSLSLGTSLNSVGKMFCRGLMEGEVLETKELRKHWNTIIRGQTAISTPNKILEGMELINKLRKWAEDVRLRIVDISTSFNINLLGRNDPIMINGDIPIIALTNKDTPEILILSFASGIPEQNKIDLSLEYTAYCYAYQKQMKTGIGIHVHHVGKNIDLYSYRSKLDFNRMKQSIINIACAIKHKIWYPRETVMCKNCYAFGICRAWHGLDFKRG